MFITKVDPRLPVATTEGTVVTFLSIATQTVDVVLENLDLSNILTFKYQSSPDNTVFTDIAAFASLAPGQRVVTSLLVGTDTFYRLRASGNLNVAVKVDAQVAFSNDFSFEADGRFQTKSVPNITVPDTSSTFVTQFTLSGLATQARRVAVENTGAVQLDGIKFQSSPDKVVWTDVAAPVALPAGATFKATLQGAVFYRLQVDTLGTTLGVKIDTELTNTNKTISVNVA